MRSSGLRSCTTRLPTSTRPTSVWEPEQALPAEFDLTSLHVHGKHRSRRRRPAPDPHLRHRSRPRRGASPESLAAAESPPASGEDPTNPAEPADPAWAIERVGANESVEYLFSLYRTDWTGLVSRGQPGCRRAGPGRPASRDTRFAPRRARASGRRQLSSTVMPGSGGTACSNAPASSALASTSSSTTARGGGSTIPTAGCRGGAPRQCVERRGDDPLGDGVFGLTPARGTRFRANYLVGNGRRGNLPAALCGGSTRPMSR